VTATGAASMISSTGAVGSVSFPAGALNVVGRTIRVRARGFISTAATAGSANFYVKLGSNIIATSLTNALVASKSTVGWSLDIDLTIKAIGTSGKTECAGMFLSGWISSGSGVFGNSNVYILNGTSAGTQVPGTQPTIDLTQAYVLDLQFNFTATGNSITVTHLTVEVIA
jgi:hypothetical protein